MKAPNPFLPRINHNPMTLKPLWIYWLSWIGIQCHHASTPEKPSSTVIAFAQSIYEASTPGLGIKEWVAGVAQQAPAQQAAYLYRDLYERWQYQADPKGEDVLANAEELVWQEKWAGDCEDFTVVVVAALRALEVSTTMVLGESDRTGHVWAEIRFAAQPPNPQQRKQLAQAFGKTAVLLQYEDGWWIQLSPPQSLRGYHPKYRIEPYGKLVPISQLPQAYPL